MTAPKPNIIHLRLATQDDEVSPTGGMTIAYHVKQQGEEIIALCGVSLCNDADGFNKKTGRELAIKRLDEITELPIDKVVSAGTKQWIDVLTLEEVCEAGKYSCSSFVDHDGVFVISPFVNKDGQFLNMHDDVTEIIIDGVVRNLKEHREATYMGDNDYVLDDIDCMLVAYLGEDADDEDGDGDGEVDPDEDDDFPEKAPS